ncbi:MAG TPA: Ig-like domain-containing protein [Longimicrobium sp.]|nr:Ig-like domain-containing protein [Longimicrobium sp.]
MTLSPKPFPRRAAALCAIALAAAACSDRIPSAPVAAPASPVAATLRCTVTVRAGTVACEPVRSGNPAARGVLLGGQGVNVRLTSSGTAYDTATQTLRTSVTVQNLTAQPLGTTNGYTPSPDGVRVFFHQKPVVQTGSGTVTVANPDGIGIFTSSNQPYFQYDGILFPDETTPAREWRFNVPLSVTSFVFLVYVHAPAPSERGWIELSPMAPSLQVGETLVLADSVRHATGQVLPGFPVTWTTSDGAVATVDAGGQVTAVGTGSATITASGGGRSGSVTLMVTAPPDPPLPTIVSVAVVPGQVMATGEDTVWAIGRFAAADSVYSSTFVLNGPGGNQLQCFGTLVGGDAAAGEHRCPLVIPAGASGGVWVLTAVIVNARGSGSRDVNLAQMRAAGAMPLVSVQSPAQDVEAPVLASFAFAPDTARAGADTVVVDIGVTDAGRGAAQATAIFRNDLDGPGVVHGCGTGGLDSGTPQSGVFRCAFGVRPNASPGTYRVIYIELIDMNGNIRYLYTPDLQAAGFPTELTVLPADPS